MTLRQNLLFAAVAVGISGCGGYKSDGGGGGGGSGVGTVTRNEILHAWTTRTLTYGGTDYPCPYFVAVARTSYQCSDPADSGGRYSMRQYNADGSYVEQNGDVSIFGTWSLSGDQISYSLKAGLNSFTLTETVTRITATELVTLWPVRTAISAIASGK